MKRAVTMKERIVLIALSLLLLLLAACSKDGSPAAAMVGQDAASTEAAIPSDAGMGGNPQAPSESPADSAGPSVGQGVPASDSTADAASIDGTYYGVATFPSVPPGVWSTLIVSNYSAQGFDFEFVESYCSGHAELDGDGWYVWDGGQGLNIGLLPTDSGIEVDGGRLAYGLNGTYTKTKPVIDPSISTYNGIYTSVLRDGTRGILLVSGCTPDGFYFKFIRNDEIDSGDAIFADDGNAYYKAGTIDHGTFRFDNDSVIVQTGFNPYLSNTYFKLNLDIRYKNQ